MKQRDLLIFSLLPTVFGIGSMLLMQSTPLWIWAQLALLALLLCIWWVLGRWCAGQQLAFWPCFWMLQGWGLASVLCCLLLGVPGLVALGMVYSLTVGSLLAVISPLGYLTPVAALVVFGLLSCSYCLGYFFRKGKRVQL